VSRIDPKPAVAREHLHIEMKMARGALGRSRYSKRHRFFRLPGRGVVQNAVGIHAPRIHMHVAEADSFVVRVDLQRRRLLLQRAVNTPSRTATTAWWRGSQRSATASRGEHAGYPCRMLRGRSFSVGQCAAFRHQGQDIARHVRRVTQSPTAAIPPPGGCCSPRWRIDRSLQQQAATLQINTHNEHIRFRYMHMNPRSHGADGVLNGTPRPGRAKKSCVVSNYLDRPTAPRAIFISMCRCSRATLALGQSLRHLDLGL